MYIYNYEKITKNLINMKTENIKKLIQNINKYYNST